MQYDLEGYARQRRTFNQGLRRLDATYTGRGRKPVLRYSESTPSIVAYLRVWSITPWLSYDTVDDVY